MISRTLTLFVGVILVARAPAQEKQSEYYPLQVGSKWHYRIGSQPVVVHVVKTEEIEVKKLVVDPQDMNKKKEVKVKVRGFVLESSSDDRVQTETVVVLEDGVYRSAAAGKEISPPICFLKLPPQKGDTWKVDSASEGMPVQGTFTTQHEEIEVPAIKGKHRAIRVTSEDFQMGKHRMKLSYWFLPGWGLVKQRLQVGTFDITMELEKYEPARK